MPKLVCLHLNQKSVTANIPTWTSNNKPRICVFESPYADGDCPIADYVLEYGVDFYAEDSLGAAEYDSGKAIDVGSCNKLFTEGKQYVVKLLDSGIPIGGDVSE